jgi:hypothetical protein
VGGEAVGIVRHRDAVGDPHARHLTCRLIEHVPRVRRLLLQRRRRRRAHLRRPAVRALLAGLGQPTQRRLRRTNRHLRLGRRVALAVVTKKPGEAAGEAGQAILLVAAIAPRGHGGLLLLGEEVVVEELIRQQELLATVGPLRRHFPPIPHHNNPDLLPPRELWRAGLVGENLCPPEDDEKN